MKYTLEQLRKQNSAYAEYITAETLEHVNALIKAVEQSRTNRPQPLDCVDFISEYGERTEHATIDGENVASEYRTTICEHCTPEPVIKDGGTVTAYTGCGGAFHSYNADKMEYKGTTAKTCKIYGSDKYGFEHFPIYFDCTVSAFKYDARSRKQYAEQAREKAIERLIGYGYDRKTAEQSFDSVTERYKRDFKSIDEYSPIIRNANETLYNCGMIDNIITG